MGELQRGELDGGGGRAGWGRNDHPRWPLRRGPVGRDGVGRTLKVGADTTLVLRSTNGQGELDGDNTRRVLEVNGESGPASCR